MATTDRTRSVVALLALAWAALAAGMATDRTAVTAPAALVIALVVPGWCVVIARPRARLVERLTLTVAISFTLLLLVVVIAAALPTGATRRSIVVGTAAVCVAAAWWATNGAERRRHTGTGDRGASTPEGAPAVFTLAEAGPAPRRIPWAVGVAALVAAGVVIGAAALVSVRSEQSWFDQPVTQLGLTPVPDQAGAYELSIVNRDGPATDYWFILEMPGEQPRRVDIHLVDGQEYRTVLAPSEAGTLQVTLFGGPASDRGYRQVRAVVH